MTNTELTILKTNIEARLQNSQIAPLFLAGVPGTGKSAAVKQVAKELNFNLVEYSCPTISVEQITGLPNEYATPEFNKACVIDTGTDVNSTIWSIPEIIAQVWTASETKPTILLLDDFHAIPAHLQSYFYNLLLEYRVGNYKLPSNAVIIGTMNDSESSGFNGIGAAVRNRMSILPIDFDFEYWMDSFGKHLHYLVASFLKAKPQHCIEDETTTIEGFASARVWTTIANELEFYDDEFIIANAKRIAGMQVSSSAAQAFQAHVNYISAINFKDVVKQRTIVDLSKQDPLDSIIYAYITNFIETVEDGLYLFDLLNANRNHSVFIGFVFIELYNKYCAMTQDNPLSDGLVLVIDKLLSKPLDPANYPNTSKAKLDKASAEVIPNLAGFMETAQGYLL